MDSVKRAKYLTRQTSNYWARSGKLRRQPCQRCGDKRAQIHHPDYSDPSTVVWLCRECRWLHHFEQSRSMFLRMLDEAQLNRPTS